MFIYLFSTEKFTSSLQRNQTTKWLLIPKDHTVKKKKDIDGADMTGVILQQLQDWVVSLTIYLKKFRACVHVKSKSTSLASFLTHVFNGFLSCLSPDKVPQVSVRTQVH